MPITDVTDTSVYQGEFDIAAFDGYGIIAKITQGSWRVDPYHARTYRAARERQLRWVGLYHFLDSSAPYDQFMNIAARCRALGLSLSEPLPAGVGIAIDCESNSVTGEPIPATHILRDLLSYLCEPAGYWPRARVGIYTYLSAKHAIERDWPGVFSVHPLWLAFPGPIHVPTDEGAVLWQFDIRDDVPGIAPRNALCDTVLDHARMDDWFGVKPVFDDKKETTMFLMQGPTGIGDGVFLLDSTTIRWVEDPAELHILLTAGVVSVTDSLDAIRMMRSKRTPFGPAPSSGGLVGIW